MAEQQDPLGFMDQLKAIVSEPRLLRIFLMAAIIAFFACAFLIKFTSN